jgi:hypothetical protein
LKDDDRLVLSGVSAVRHYSADLIAGDEIEGYVKASGLEDIVHEYGLIVSSRPNVQLRSVDDDCWPFDDGIRVAPSSVVAIDLFDSSDPRSHRAGIELWEKVARDRP